ncbi:Aste57867_23176 [Aphanomyces stellatus]|uniref:Aste57867_23176 protein n=1 Tax=Aphanomyces stellatus TaxID=120398 RepID=A0A485LNY3_9STRA|nr:hypothetical protein As57867_023105 [Aphanomyces stellatus]VFT99824.1 Aste57867_23176 [Aphanomyces stellatus]
MAALRDYQEDVMKLAREKNVIMVGNTGIGKTFVSIMLLREQDYSMKRAFVLAPTRQLVYQIHSKILKLTTLKVDVYCGRELEVWDQMKWEYELLLNSVLVCTPEILRNLVMKGYITMTRINLLVFDECHHVGKRHPYNQIMKLYNPMDKRHMPRIFGTTSCPTKDCARNMHAVPKVIQLEQDEMTKYAACAPVIHEYFQPNIDCHPSTVVGLVTTLLSELNVVEVYSRLMSQGKFQHSSTPEKRGKRMTKLLDDCKTIYQSLGPWCLYRFLELEIEKLARKASLRWTTVGSVVGLDARAVELLLRCADKRLQTQMACTPKVDKIVEIVHEKLFGGRVALVPKAHAVGGGAAIFQDSAAMHDAEDHTVYMEVDDDDDDDDDDAGMGSGGSDVEDDPDVDFEPLAGTGDGDAPFDAARSLDKQLKCVLFVNRRAECRVLSDYLNARFATQQADDGNDDDGDGDDGDDDGLELFGCMLGQASASDAASFDAPDMHSLLQGFESGAVRVLVSTSVSCEGVDFPLCSMVICADPVPDPRKFIQIRGRARHADGVFFYLTDISSVEDTHQFEMLVRQAEAIGTLRFHGDKPVTLSKEPRSIAALVHHAEYTVLGLDDGELVEATCSLRVESTGAILDLDSSIPCLNMFCQSLPDHEKQNLQPTYEYVTCSIDRKPMFKAILTLPAPLQMGRIETGFMKSKGVGKALAAFKACELLFQQGKLDGSLNSVYRRKKLRDIVLANEIQSMHDRAKQQSQQQAHHRAA